MNCANILSSKFDSQSSKFLVVSMSFEEKIYTVYHLKALNSGEEPIAKLLQNFYSISNIIERVLILLHTEATSSYSFRGIQNYVDMLLVF